MRLADKPIAGWGGLVVIIGFRRSGIAKAAEETFGELEPGSNRAYKSCDLIVSLMAANYMGDNRAEHMDLLRQDAHVRAMAGRGGILPPSQHARRRKLHRYAYSPRRATYGGFIAPGVLAQLALCLIPFL